MIREIKGTKALSLFSYYFFSTVILVISCCTKNDLFNKLIYNVFFLITICFFSYFFRSILFDKTKRFAINIICIINVCLFTKFDFVLKKLYEVNTVVYAIAFLSIVIYSLLYFEQLISNVNESNLLYQFDFWLVSGYLIYFLGSFFIILFYNNVETDQRGIVWALQNIILFLSSAVALMGSLWIHYRRKYY